MGAGRSALNPARRRTRCAAGEGAARVVPPGHHPLMNLLSATHDAPPLVDLCERAFENSSVRELPADPVPDNVPR